MSIYLNSNLMKTSIDLTKPRKFTVNEMKILIFLIRTFRNRNYILFKGLFSKKTSPSVIEQRLNNNIELLNEPDKTIEITKEIRDSYFKKSKPSSLLKILNNLIALQLIKVTKNKKIIKITLTDNFIKSIYIIDKTPIVLDRKDINGGFVVSESIFKLKNQKTFPLFMLLSKFESISFNPKELNTLLNTDHSTANLVRLINLIIKDIDRTGEYQLKFKKMNGNNIVISGQKIRRFDFNMSKL